MIVNASSVGLKQNETPIDLKLFKENPKYVFDMIYNPYKNKTIRDCYRAWYSKSKWNGNVDQPSKRIISNLDGFISRINFCHIICLKNCFSIYYCPVYRIYWRNMSIDRETILKVANLARLRLSESEIEKMKTDLNKILNYVDQLNSVNTENVKPLVSVLDVDTVMRADISEPSLKQEDALRNAPDKNSDYFKVPKVLGQ